MTPPYVIYMLMITVLHSISAHVYNEMREYERLAAVMLQLRPMLGPDAPLEAPPEACSIHGCG